MPKSVFTKENLCWVILSVVLFGVLTLLMQAGIINSYYRITLFNICINIMLAVSLNLVIGICGQFSLGHAGFMSIGAYSAALFVKYIESTGVVLLADGSPTPQGQLFFVLSLLLGGCLAAVFGLLVGIPALRLKGDTLGFGEIIRSLIENLSFTGGAQGLKKIPRLATLDTVYMIMALCVVVMFTLVRSRHGLAITAIREDDIASEASGIHNTYYKVLAFTVAAFFAGIAGGIYAQYLGVLGAANFNFNKSIDILVMVVLGGMGSLTGSIVAAIGLTALPELLRFIPNFSDYRMLIYSIVLIIVMIFKPSGLLGRYEFSLTRVLEGLSGRGRKGGAGK